MTKQISIFMVKGIILVLSLSFFVGMMYYGMGREIARKEAVALNHLEKCETLPNYYPEFCEHLRKSI